MPNEKYLLKRVICIFELFVNFGYTFFFYIFFWLKIHSFFDEWHNWIETEVVLLKLILHNLFLILAFKNIFEESLSLYFLELLFSKIEPMVKRLIDLTEHTDTTFSYNQQFILVNQKWWEFILISPCIEDLLF